jgi:hypothetical protein
MWAAAPVTEEFKASEDRLKLSRSIMSRYISTVYVKCRNGSLKPALAVARFAAWHRWSVVNLRV